MYNTLRCNRIQISAYYLLRPSYLWHNDFSIINALVNSHCDSLNSNFANNGDSAADSLVECIIFAFFFLLLLVVFPSASIELECTHRRYPSMMKYVILFRFIRIVISNGIDGTRMNLFHWHITHRFVVTFIYLFAAVQSVAFRVIFHYFLKLLSERNCNKKRWKWLPANTIDSELRSFRLRFIALTGSIIFPFVACVAIDLNRSGRWYCARGEIFLWFHSIHAFWFLWTRNAMIRPIVGRTSGENYRKEEQQCS